MKEVIDQYGSFITRGKLYDVVQLRGPVAYRQDKANELRVIAYAEGHCNSDVTPKPNYAMTIIAHEFSRPWANVYLNEVCAAGGHPNGGVHFRAKGWGLISRVRWPAPALVLEPGFLSNPVFAEWMTRGSGVYGVGKSLAESVRISFPEGGLFGHGVGHAYRGNGDKGAPVHEDFDENPEYDQEAELAEAYLDVATEALVNYE